MQQQQTLHMWYNSKARQSASSPAAEVGARRPPLLCMTDRLRQVLEALGNVRPNASPTR